MCSGDLREETLGLHALKRLCVPDLCPTLRLLELYIDENVWAIT